MLKIVVRGGPGRGQRAHHYQATGGQPGQTITDQVPQTALHQVAHDRGTHGLAHDETRTRRRSPLGDVRVEVARPVGLPPGVTISAEMDDQQGPAGPATIGPAANPNVQGA